MILAHNEIKAALDSGAWTCHRDGVRVGSDQLTINSNSVNVSLSDIELWPIILPGKLVDLHDADSVKWHKERFIETTISPGEFSLMHVRERFDCAAPLMIHGRKCYFAPMIEGRSTSARCGLSIHATAGFGDYFFGSPGPNGEPGGNFTLEISSHLPIILRPGDEIAQISFVEVSSPTKYNSVYSDQYDEPRAPVLGRNRFRRFE